MFGKNDVEKTEMRADGSLRVVQGSPFYTIQGEGPFSGKGAVFLRLHGCNLRCFFCDTEFSRPEDTYVSTFDLQDAIQTVAPSWCRLLVITGGEPVRQNLYPIIRQMTDLGWTVQVETAGTLWQDCLLDTIIVCSPKTPRIHPQILQYAHVFKYVIRAGETDDCDGLPVTNTQVEDGLFQLLARPRPGAEVYLSPMDEGDTDKNGANILEVARSAMRFGHRAGVQLHKLMNLP